MQTTLRRCDYSFYCSLRHYIYIRKLLSPHGVVVNLIKIKMFATAKMITMYYKIRKVCADYVAAVLVHKVNNNMCVYNIYRVSVSAPRRYYIQTQFQYYYKLSILTNTIFIRTIHTWDLSDWSQANGIIYVQISLNLW